MIQNDYILRMIEQFAKMIASIILRRKAGDHKGALEQIQTTSRLYLKIELEELIAHTPEQMVESFRDPKGQLDLVKCVLCADLLLQLTLLSEEKGQKEASLELKKSCLYLYQLAIPKEKQFQTPEYESKITALEMELGVL